MCGRMVATKLKALARSAGIPLRDILDDWGRDRYNLAPAQSAVTLHQVDGAWEPHIRKWGLVPFWAKDLGIGTKLINARAETVSEKPSFRAAFKKSRVLIPISGFYEWAVIAGRKHPFFIHPADGGLWFFAGLAETWKSPDGLLESFTVITTTANHAMVELHDRMPVILGPEARITWMSPDTSPSDLQSILVPCPDEWLEAYEVGPAVGNVRNDTPSLIDPSATDDCGDPKVAGSNP